LFGWITAKSIFKIDCRIDAWVRKLLNVIAIVTRYDQFVMFIYGGFCERFIGFPNPDASGNATGSLQDLRTNLFQEIFCHVFGSRVVRQDEQAAWFDHSQGLNCIFILFANKEAVVPMFIQPAFALGLQVCEVHDSPYGILPLPLDKEIGDVVMPMKVFAFAPMMKQPMASAKLDATHNGQTHEKLIPCKNGGVFGRHGLVLEV
jgi:hypothetical protein